jgi:hypothetical protein
MNMGISEVVRHGLRRTRSSPSFIRFSLLSLIRDLNYIAGSFAYNRAGVLTLSTLDFSKPEGSPPGEAFEGLIRLVLERLGTVVEWTGRGADGGRDLIFIETQRGPIKARPVRWLVSCKDHSKSGRSVTQTDVGSVLEKVTQHECDGFLLATTTTASTGLKQMLDKFDISARGSIQTRVWDRFHITKMLRSDRFSHLLMQFFSGAPPWRNCCKAECCAGGS